MAGNLEPRRGLISDSYELYLLLQKEDLLKEKPPMWWPAYGNFEVLIGAILTQNSQWKRVEVSLKNLNGYLDVDSLIDMDTESLERLIQPSGLYKSKAKYIKLLVSALKEDYGDFGSFCTEVNRTWLLSQKGIGPETADSILCYACKREVMVVDTYTARLLSALGYEFGSYDDLQEWCVKGLFSLDDKGERFKVYALFHAMIVEFVKANSKGKKINIESLKW